MNTFQFPVTSPEAQGVRSTAIRHFVEAVEEKGLELHSFILLRHGIKIAEGWWNPYRSEYPHMLFSLSKSFTSSAIGLAVAEGLLSVEDKIISFFPDQLPEKVSSNLAAMRIHHLLSMSTGHAEDTTRELRSSPDGDWVKAFLSLPVGHQPGTLFVYNSGATYMLSAIMQKVTGMQILEYLRPRLFDPLGIENPAWESCPMGINTGGWGLSIRTEDIARFGQLYLQKGQWNGKRVLPGEWIEQASGKQVSNGSDPKSDWNQGYGYQFWRCRYGAYRGDGAFGQYCIVMPEQDAVLAITGGLGDMQAVLNLVWKHILKPMTPSQLKENRRAWGLLKQKLAHLSLRQPEGAIHSPVMDRIDGVQYQLEPNPVHFETAQIQREADQIILSISAVDQLHVVHSSLGELKAGQTSIYPQFGGESPVETISVWPDPEQLLIKMWFTHTPFSLTIACQYADDRIEIEINTNVTFGPTNIAKLVGKRIR